MIGSPNHWLTRYDVVLVSPGPKPRRVARTIATFTDQKAAEALQTIQTAPVLILQDESYATAEGARQALQSLGANVEVRTYEVEAPEPVPQPRAGWKVWQVALAIAAMVVVLALLLLASFVQEMNDFFSGGF
jgi:hypothetical protein